MTVAYIAKSAPDTAAFLALGCTEIVMNKDATLRRLLRHHHGEEAAAPSSTSIRTSTRPRANRWRRWRKMQGYPVLLVRGLMDRQLEIWHVRHTHDRANWPS